MMPSRLLRRPGFLLRPFLGIAALLCFAALLPAARAGESIYAKFGNGTGAYAGEVTTPAAYAGWALIPSVSNGFSHAHVTGQTTTPAASDISFLRSVDRLSPQLFQLMLTGSVIGGSTTAVGLTVDFVQAGATTPYLRLEFKNAYVDSQSNSASTGDNGVYESISISFDAVRMTYYPATGNPIVYSWTFSTNQASF